MDTVSRWPGPGSPSEVRITGPGPATSVLAYWSPDFFLRNDNKRRRLQTTPATMEEEAITIIDCYADGDEVCLEKHSEHRILAEHPYLPKRKHSIITLQTTTILRIPSSGSSSKLSIILPVTVAANKESVANQENKSFASCEEKCTSQPFEVLGKSH